jgi:gas vesicle protein
MTQRNGDFGSFLSGLLLGGLVGSAVALLMAPQSGDETRQLLREKGIELKDRTNEGLEAAYARAEAAAAEARARADELAVVIKERGEDLRERGQAVIDAAKAPAKKKASSGNADKKS